MAIIGNIRKHSGLAVIIIGVAIAAFVIGDFGGKSVKTNDIGVVNGESIPYAEFNNKVETNLEAQKENSGNDKITDQDSYQVRQSTWTATVKELLMGGEYQELGLTVSPEELFDQVQGKQPHRFILQYFKDPATGQYDPALVLNYLKNLDKMEPKARDQWMRFERAIKDDRQETKFNNLLTKGFYVPKAFLKKEFANQSKALKVFVVSPDFLAVSDSSIKLVEADYQKFYDKNKPYFYMDEASRDIDYVVFEVKPSEFDRKKTAEDVVQLFKDFQSSSDAMNFSMANSDMKVDSMFVKKGSFPPQLDSVLFAAKPGELFSPFEFSNAWYMAKLIEVQERPDSMNGSQILIAYTGTGNENIKRTKAEAKAKADSLLAVLKKNPEKFAEAAKQTSDYPTVKDDAGDLKWFTDGNPNFDPFFKAGIEMKPNDVKVIDTRIGYSLFLLTNKTKPVKKVKTAMLVRSIEPSNQTFQDTYMKASAFAGQNKTPETFEKTATEKGLQKRVASNVRAMDNMITGLPTGREVVRWAFAEKTKVGEISPVFDVNGKYVIALLKSSSEKGQQPLETIKTRIEPSVKNMKKIELTSEKMKQAAASVKDIAGLASNLGAKLDTVVLTFSGFNRSNIGREGEIVGQVFNTKKGELLGPLTGNYGAYFCIINEVTEAPAKEDFTSEYMQQLQNFNQRVTNGMYQALEKTAKITDNRLLFY